MKKYICSLLISMVIPSLSFAKEVIQIKGSDTIVNLVQKLSEEYMKINKESIIAVTGGGSGTGIAALINKKCDIADASRSIKNKEVQNAKENKIDVKSFVIATDSLSIIVNKKNPLTKLTTVDVGRIYRGEIKNWKELGSIDKAITLYGRQPNSGTYDFLREEILKGDYSKNMREMNGNSQIVEAVKNDLTAIGYVGVAYAKSEKMITVLKIAEDKNKEYLSPLDTKNIDTAKYPITRPLFQYISADANKKVNDFISFELGKEGQRLVEKEGFFKVQKKYVAENLKNIK